MEVIAAWISAITSVLALCAAVWAGLTAKKLYDVESGRDRVAENDRRRADAARVNAWTSTHIAPSPEEGIPGARIDGITLVNGGDTPIYSVHVASCGRDGVPLPRLTQQVLPPGEYFVGQTRDSYHWDFPNEARHLLGMIRPITKHEKWRVTEIRFTDSNGVVWTRNQAGQLAEG